MPENEAVAAPGRTPPHDQNAEMSVLGAMLIKPEVFEEVKAALETDHFFFPVHREIYDAICFLVQDGCPIDVLALMYEIRKRGQWTRIPEGEMFFLKLTNCIPTAENVLHYVRIVRQCAQLRHLIAVCAEIQSRAYGDFGQFEEFMDEAESQVFTATSGVGTSDEPVRVGDVVDRTFETMEAKGKDASRFFVRTGLRGFDKKIGGLGREQLIVVAARPGGGKSSWALNCAVNASEQQGTPVLYFQLEMSRQELIERGIGYVSSVETRKIHRGDLAREDWLQIDNGKRLRPLPLYVYDQRIGLDRMTAIAKRWAARVRRSLPLAPDGLPALVLVVVDYLQLMPRTAARGQSEEGAIAHITTSMKGLAKDLKSPVMLLSQLNREIMKDSKPGAKQRPPRTSDLKGSGAIEADADIVMFTCPEDPPPAPRVKGEPVVPVMRVDAHILVDKHRGGARGAIPCVYDKSIMAFTDHPPEYDEEADARYAP